MKTTTTQLLKKENRLSYGILVTCFDNNIESDRFVIPVIDVRDGAAERVRVNNIIKQSNTSKFIHPSFSVIGKSYQVSHKKTA